MTLLAVEITAATDSQGTTTVLRYATEGYKVSSAPGLFRERIQETVDIRREIRGADGGQASVGFSDLILTNADGDLDDLEGYGFDGRPITGYLLDDENDAWGNRRTLFTATMGAPSFTFDQVTIPIKDRLGELDQPLHSNTYAGTNSLPDGLEGTEADIKGSPKPEPEGLVFNAQPPLVNTSRLIYEFAAGDRDADVTGVYEGGLAITQGSDYTSQSDMESNPPNSGEFRVWPRSSGSGGYFRLGSSPTLPITCDVQAGAASGDRTVAQVLKSLAERAPTIDSADVSSTDVSDLDNALSYPIGVWQPREASILRTMESVAVGAGVWFGFDRNGTLRMGKWDAPSGNAQATFKEADATAGVVLADGEHDLIDIEGQGTRDEDTPVFEVAVRYRRNRASGVELAGGISDARRAELESEWRREVATDSSVQNKHKNARKAELDGPWDTSAGASDAASRTLTRDSVLRRRWRLSAALERGLDTDVDLGDTVSVDLDRYGMSGGKLHLVRRIEVDPVAGRVEYLIWG